MYRMSGLGRNSIVVLLILAVCLVLSGCCRFNYNRGNCCSWPSCSLEMGIVPMPWGMRGGCQPCDPCGSYAQRSVTQSTDDWGYDNSEYLSSAEGASGAAQYY